MTNTPGQPIWSPSKEAIENSQLTDFMHWLSREHGLQFAAYTSLHGWSVQQPGDFWSAYAQYSNTIFSVPASKPVTNLDQFPGAKWFPDAQLNFAENLLVERSDKTAFVSILENGQRRTFSYATVFQQTELVSTWLRDINLAVGDRVAAWLPNIPEAAIAMLASSSVGAVWSSCSPDFGVEGALDRFGQIEPRVLFACDGYYYGGKVIDVTEKVRDVAAKVPSIETIVWVPVIAKHVATLANEVTWDELLALPAQPLEFTPLPFDQPLYIMYSSGTTGKPKCIVHGQGGTLLQHKKEHQMHLDLRTNDTLFFFTTCGWMMWNWLISALASRCTIVLFDGSPFHPQPSTMFDICQSEGVSVFGISAKFLGSAQKAQVCPVESHDLTNMRMLISTGSPLTQEGFQYVYQQVKPSCHLVSMSGGTDLISCFMARQSKFAGV